jgi:hypothetical protein
MKRIEHARHHRVLARCSKEIKMYTNNTRMNIISTEALIDSDAASRITKAGIGYDSSPGLKDVMHFRADSERSVP